MTRSAVQGDGKLECENMGSGVNCSNCGIQGKFLGMNQMGDEIHEF